MKPFTPKKLALAVSAQLALTAGVAPLAIAQEDSALEEVVITGTRRQARSVFDSAAPIDVISGDDLRDQGGSDLVDLIRNTVPSYNANTQPISDAATVIRPANMRGLAPDHTLVLLNGKRRHRASVITWLGNGVSDGAQGPDISVFPSIALKQVEVLRDGAAAQYGSDAIAGVMNFILKDDSEGGSIEAKYGEFDEEGENSYSIAGNIGLPFTSKGFVNASFEYSEADDTDRSVQRDDAQALIDGGNTAVADPAQIWGSPEVNDNIKTIFNMGLELDDSTEFYAFGNYAYKEVDGGFYFRNPDTRPGVFGTTLNNPNYTDGTALPGFESEPESVDVRLVADITGCDSQYIGNVTSVAGQPFTYTGSVPGQTSGANADQLNAIVADESCFIYNRDFPGGFTPRFGADTKDASLVAGVRGNLDNGLNYDVSASWGWNDSDFFIYNTVNASLGGNTPTSFDPGDYTQTEYNFNADVSYPLEVDMFASDLNIAGGFEFRTEVFEITAGDAESFNFGDLASQGFSAASNGFPGFSALISDDWDRQNVAAYLDLETDVVEDWLVGVAVRWEDYDDFGSTVNGKFSTHYQVLDSLGLRGTYSTGFRAPTPGQSNAFNVSTEFDAGLGILVNRGVVPPDNPISQTRGGEELEEETSNNWTLGLVWQWENFSVTADYFNIEVDDRISLSQDFTLTDEERDGLIESGVTAAGNIRDFRFFVNDFDTETKGWDVVASYSLESSIGLTDFNVAYNHTETEVTGRGETIDDNRVQELEEGLPENRVNFGITHTMDQWRFMARTNWTDEWFDSEDGVTYDSYYTVDIEGGYSFENGLAVMLGANNVTDETPDDNEGAAAGVGNAYSQFSPLGFNGAFYYARLTYDF
jgi:iron complex outermembrane receptor protein